MGDHFLFQNHAQMPNDLLRRHILEVKLQTTRQHRGRQFLRIRGGQQEFHMRRRFFQCFEQRIETVVGQHMDFIDQVDFIARASGGVLDIIQQFARILYLGTRSSINLQQVYAAAFSNLQA